MSMSITALAIAYGNAWADHDPAAIAALHTPDSVFHLHNVSEPWCGREAIASAAAQFFNDSPDLKFDRVRVHIGEDHFVTEYIMKGTLEGAGFACDGTDVFSVNNGLVARKDSYVDWVTYAHQTGSTITPA